MRRVSIQQCPSNFRQFSPHCQTAIEQFAAAMFLNNFEDYQMRISRRTMTEHSKQSHITHQRPRPYTISRRQRFHEEILIEFLIYRKESAVKERRHKRLECFYGIIKKENKNQQNQFPLRQPYRNFSMQISTKKSMLNSLEFCLQRG